MAFNVVIVDDEYYVRQSIKAKINLPFFNIVLDTDNGKELIEYIKRGLQSVHLVLVDIVMPLMDGLTLIQELQKINPELYFLVLSGYSDFKYMQKAIQIGVSDYVMKPIIPETLNKSLTDINQKLMERDCERAQNCMDNLCRHIVNKGKIEIDSYNEYFFKQRFENGYRIILSLLGNWESNIYWFDIYKKNEWCSVYPGIPNLLVTITSVDTQMDIPPVIDFTTITTYRSGKLRNLRELTWAVDEGLKALKNSMILGKMVSVEADIPFTLFDEGIAAWKSGSVQEIDKIIIHIKKKEYSKAIKCAGLLFQYPDIPQVNIEETWKVLAMELFKLFPGCGELLEDSWIRVCDDKLSFKASVIELIDHILDNSSCGERVETGAQVMNKIITYVNSNFQDNITLKDTADTFFINRSHLARSFKQITGKTFNEYITGLRIKKACELLRDTTRSMSEISYLIGYEDSRYFSQIFLKTIGISPSHYRQKLSLKLNG